MLLVTEELVWLDRPYLYEALREGGQGLGLREFGVSGFRVCEVCKGLELMGLGGITGLAVLGLRFKGLWGLGFRV